MRETDSPILSRPLACLAAAVALLAVAIGGAPVGVAEATQEAIYNSLLKATTVSGMGRTADAIDIEEVVRVLREYNVIRP